MGASKSSKLGSRTSMDYQQLLQPLPQQYSPSAQQASILKCPQKQSLRTYIMMINDDEKITCLNSLKFRKQHPQQFIQICYGEIMCSQTQYTKLKVYVQHIVLNLQQLMNVHFYDMMAIFHKVFKGFKILYSQFGNFTPDPRMIGFTQAAQVKVWGHVKYSKSKPQVSYQMLNQSKMIQQLIQIFTNKVDINTLPFDSHRKQFKFMAKTFDQAIQLIENQVQTLDLIPKNIKSIALMLQAGRKIQENDIISMNSEYYIKNLDKTIKFNYSNPDPNKKKVNFTFGAQSETPRRNSSLPKVNFTASTQPMQKVTFNAINPQNLQSSQDSRIQTKLSIDSPIDTLKSNKSTRSNSLVKFTYK